MSDIEKSLVKSLKEANAMSEIQGELCEIIAQEIEDAFENAAGAEREERDWEEMKWMCEDFLRFKEAMMEKVWESFWDTHRTQSEELREMIRKDVMNKQGKDGYKVLWEYACDNLELWKDKEKCYVCDECSSGK
jgi:hypothetical protein